MAVKQVTLPTDRRQAFEMLHEQRLLGEYETLSGVGSQIGQTYNLRRSLAFLIETRQCTSLLDVGCGDFNWMSAVDLREVSYLGIDIVASIVDENRRRWPDRRFEVMDVVEMVPPQYDLVLCKDVFTHLPNRDTVNAINNIKKSGARYLAVTTYYPELVKQVHASHYKNINRPIAPAYWRPMNLRLKPFYLPPPLATIAEQEPGKALDLWALEDVPFLEHAQVGKPPEHNPATLEDFMRYRFFRELVALSFIDQIDIFGSRASLQHKPESDIDLMIYCQPGTTRQQWLQVCELVRCADIPLSIDCVRHGNTVKSTLDYFESSDCRTLYRRDHGA